MADEENNKGKENQEPATLDTVVRELKKVNSNLRALRFIGGAILAYTFLNLTCSLMPNKAKADTLDTSNAMQVEQKAYSGVSEQMYNAGGNSVYMIEKNE